MCESDSYQSRFKTRHFLRLFESKILIILRVDAPALTVATDLRAAAAACFHVGCVVQQTSARGPHSSHSRFNNIPENQE